MRARGRLLAPVLLTCVALAGCGGPSTPAAPPVPTERQPATFALSEAVRHDLANQKEAARKRNADFEALLEAK